MRVLVACEYSATVRDAFRKLGHDAVSCDVLETEVPGPHYRGDVLDILEDGWDLLIAHPPCTFLSLSGAGHMYLGKGKAEKQALGYQIDPVRWAAMEAGADFFNTLYAARIPRVAVENPVMHGWGIERTGGRATQFVQPWQFGHGETKKTGFRLKNLPPLEPTNEVAGREQRVWKMGPGPNRWKERSRTFPGIARAMAKQWGKLPVLALEDPDDFRPVVQQAGAL